jgi:hypothetical protein
VGARKAVLMSDQIAQLLDAAPQDAEKGVHVAFPRGFDGLLP